MNILVTGHTGFIGGAILDRLNQITNDGYHNTIGIKRDHNSIYNPFNNPGGPHHIVYGDIRDFNFIRRVISDYEIEEIYHCAAQAIVRSCAEDPYTTFDINVMGTVSLLEACRVSGSTVKSIVISTSDKAFGHANIPYTEETSLKPLYTYETSKACQQFVSLCYYYNYNLPVKVVACSNVYGPGDPNLSRIIPNTICQLAKNKPAMLNDGVAHYIREFVYITDVVDAFIITARHGINGEVYCCGGTEHLTMKNLIVKICTLMDKDPSKYISMFQRSNLFKEIEKQYINSSKLRSIGWTPKISLDDGLRQCIDYYSTMR